MRPAQQEFYEMYATYYVMLIILHENSIRLIASMSTFYLVRLSYVKNTTFRHNEERSIKGSKKNESNKPFPRWT